MNSKELRELSQKAEAYLLFWLVSHDDLWPDDKRAVEKTVVILRKYAK